MAGLTDWTDADQKTKKKKNKKKKNTNKTCGWLDASWSGARRTTTLTVAEVDARLYGDQHPVPDRVAVMAYHARLHAAHIRSGGVMNHVTGHIARLFQGLPGARTSGASSASATNPRLDDPLALLMIGLRIWLSANRHGMLSQSIR